MGAQPTQQEAPSQALSTLGNHVPALDGVRGIAVLLVLFFHFPAPFPWLRPLASLGWCGVDLFFVLSGYLITGILYSSAGRPHYFRNFYVRRSLRIFPLYYGFMVLTLLILPKFVNSYWLGLETLHGGVAEFFLYYSNYATVFTGWSPVSLGAFWSLAVEEHFYLFWPLFIKVTPKNKLLAWCTIVALVALSTRLVIAVFKISWLAAYFLTTSRVDSLVVGAITAILVRQNPDWPKRWMMTNLGTMLAILSLVAIWRGGLRFDDWPMRTFGYSILALLFAGVIWLAATTRGRVSNFLGNPILVTFGKYSYCLYVFHMLVLNVCGRWLGPRLFPALGWSGNAPLPLFLVSMTGTCMIAYLSWRFYESPFLILKGRLSS